MRFIISFFVWPVLVEPMFAVALLMPQQQQQQQQHQQVVQPRFVSPSTKAFSFNPTTTKTTTTTTLRQSSTTASTTATTATTTSTAATSAETLSTSLALLEEQEELKRIELRNQLPDYCKTTGCTKLEEEFRNLLENILYTPIEIEAIANGQVRSIYKGIAASASEHAVYRAFEVLYEDYMPLRMAGRVVYGRLKEVMKESIQYRKTQFEELLVLQEKNNNNDTDDNNDIINNNNNNDIDLSLETLLFCWSSFIRLAGDRKLSKDKIVYIESSIQDVNNKNNDNKSDDGKSSSSLPLDLNPDGKKSVTFAEIMSILYNFAKETTTTNNNNNTGNANLVNDPESFIKQIWDQDWNAVVASSSSHPDNGTMTTTTTTTSNHHNFDPKLAKYNDRYNEMIDQFHEWKDYIPTGEGRRLDILKGCFVGSQNEAVVEALRIIYVENSALRMSGNWIFKVVSTIMTSHIGRQQQKKNKTQ